MIKEKKGILVTLAVVLLFSFSLVDCAKKPAAPGPVEQMTQTQDREETPATPGKVEKYTPPAGEVPPPQEPKAVRPGTTREAAAFGVSDLVDVFFEFDSSDLTLEWRDRLADNASFLKAAPGIRIVIEGHCDERGTNEYNLGLGEQRANAVRNYLISLGVSASRIRTISYGEEKPFAVGHNESAWKQNRRAHFVAN
ncbi:MAG: peptidoglycan-associated lipoprotein Pal [bacterium]|nr:peptidoglycan-associated lipoprotein Pal [bacterium]MDT8395262.1 peptidoglycan-associated lipoprotein Pal [bacterium]